ncbi:sporulation protein YunB [Tumebacillus permanentifrigoris]|uniref:Sporulation protein YunB n=1 Tax=Tumebacillus permanentifrigoris TaxID=378543 RepID=A0A316D5K7_9BACL|nr:sporulation protein YunB [Tumebacillus permanentifrigoris]PWK09047.1 sporulation protein YunB [Tumebacillus permanentifrigoris]
MAMKVGRRKRLNWRLTLFLILVMIVFSTVQTVYYYETSMRPHLILAAEQYAKQHVVQTINDAISKKIADEANYNLLMNFREGPNGKISAGYFNMQEATRLQAKVTDYIQADIKQLKGDTISLPLGLVYESSILASIGPSIPVEIRPISMVKSEVGYETKEAGINQSVHVLYLDITVQETIVIPFSSKPSQIHTRVPIAYLVLVGDVPQMVFNAKGDAVGASTGGAMPPVQLPNLNEPEKQAE